jgi:hypothetical protein
MMAKLPRRDRCYLTGKRARLMPLPAAARAWYCLASHLEEFGERDMPKFNDLLAAIRQSTITAHDQPPL